MPEAPPKKINPSKFMGASFAAGSKLEDKVENNSKKISHLAVFSLDNYLALHAHLQGP